MENLEQKIERGKQIADRVKPLVDELNDLISDALETGLTVSIGNYPDIDVGKRAIDVWLRIETGEDTIKLLHPEI